MNKDLPPNKTMFFLLGSLMILSALYFSWANNFKIESGHVGLASIGGVFIALAYLLSDDKLAVFSTLFILINIISAIVLLIN